MLRLHAFPAQDGDCLLLSYGDPARQWHILVDGGRERTYVALRPALREIATRGEKLDLMVLTHIDADHIEGTLKLTGDRAQPIEVGEVWFNGFQKLTRLQAFSPSQGDRFSNAIESLGWCWNGTFAENSVGLPANLAPHPHELAGGLRVTLLSPDETKLELLRKAWLTWRNRKPEDKQAPAGGASTGLQPMGRRPIPSPLDVDALADAPEEFDATVNNGSSIAFVAEYDGKRILLAGDAHNDLLVRGLRYLAGREGGSYRLDLFKLSHHGSMGNTSRELLGLIQCPRFLFSTDGSRHGHPDPQTVARILKFCNGPSGKKALYFNYRQDYSNLWDDVVLQQTHSYECVFPEPGEQGQIIVEL